MKIKDIYDMLYKNYGAQHWWPGDSPWEICVGAVLTQNTNWSNVGKAIANLKREKVLSPEKISSMPRNELEKAIKPSGYYRLKRKRLLSVTEWWLENVRDNSLSSSKTPSEWRKSILEVHGVGPETADSILLYSFNLPSFVIDTYTKRIMHRHFNTPADIDYHELQGIFTSNLPVDVRIYNEFHALIVRLGKDHCRKNECRSECPFHKIPKLKNIF